MIKVANADGVFEELANLSFYIAKDNEEIAQRFPDACDGTFRFLAENPGIGSIRRFNSKAPFRH